MLLYSPDGGFDTGTPSDFPLDMLDMDFDRGFSHSKLIALHILAYALSLHC